MNATPGHPDRERLAEFLRGTLENVAHEAVAAHIAECNACCQALREIPDDAFAVKLRDAGVPAPPTAPRPGDPLPPALRDHPRYKVGKFLGAGGMGLVFQAEHRLMDRIVALKVLHQELLAKPRIVQRFRQEVKAAARLAHPNIVTAFDADQAGDAHFLVMEFVDGVSLDRLVARRGPLDPAYACNYVHQAAKGLDHAFQAGMVHRDIKPQNLMLTRKGQIKILDFGLARLASESHRPPAREVNGGIRPGNDALALTHLGDIMGTPAFMAPEQAIDPSKADIRADIYSLGCTLYYLLTAQAPFRGESPRARALQAKPARPEPIARLRLDLPAGLAEVVEKMMAPAPADRFASPAEVVKALTPFTKPAPLTKPAPVAPEKKPEYAPAPIPQTPVNDAPTFLARCPFCLTRIRIPARGLGASLPCPQCGNFFTSVPENDSAR